MESGILRVWSPQGCRRRSPATRPSSSTGRVGGWTQPIRAGAIGRQHGPPVAVSSVGQTERGTSAHVATQLGRFPSSARPLAWAQTENDTLMPTADAMGSKTPDARFLIARFQIEPCRFVAVGLHRAARENGIAFDLSDEVVQNRVPGGLAASCLIALAERMDSGVVVRLSSHRRYGGQTDADGPGRSSRAPRSRAGRPSSYAGRMSRSTRRFLESLPPCGNAGHQAALIPDAVWRGCWPSTSGVLAA